MTSAARARCNCSASRSSSTAPPRTSRCSSNMACRTKCSIPAGCIAAEPGLATSTVKFVGGLRLPQDETGDCHMFTQALAKEAAKLGVQFKFNTSIERLETDGAKITGVVTSAGTLHADAYVAALGSWSPRMLKPLGIAVPVYPVKGYSITAPDHQRCRRRPRLDHHGRELQGGHHAPGRHASASAAWPRSRAIQQRPRRERGVAIRWSTRWGRHVPTRAGDLKARPATGPACAR